jgi:hypothetical protein
LDFNNASKLAKSNRKLNKEPNPPIPPDDSSVMEVETSSPEPPLTFHGPSLPDSYIKIIPHPHSLVLTPVIIPLSFSTMLNASTSLHTQKHEYIPHLVDRPWAPFLTLEDFEYTETAVTGLLSKDLVNKQLSGFNSQWEIGGSCLTLHSYNDMALQQARRYVVQVCFRCF